MAYNSTDIEAAWASTLWSHPTIGLISEKLVTHEILIENEFDLEELCVDGSVNFFQAITLREGAGEITGKVQYTFQVQVFYYLQEADADVSTWSTVRDARETLDDLVRTELGKTWGNTVDYYSGGKLVNLNTVTIGGRVCWRGGITYLAYKGA
jgi:hypothetical protein